MHPLLRSLLCFAAMTLSAVAFAQSRETLGEGDAIRITVFQNPDLTTETRISERGTITFPLIGEIGLAGVAAAITEAVHHATGVRVRELPVKIEDLLA